MSTYTHSRRRTVLHAAVAIAALAGALLAPSTAAFAADAAGFIAPSRRTTQHN